MMVADFIFDFLMSKGVDTAFLVTGGQAMYLNDALARRPEIRSICTHHEQSAGMSADAYSRITGKLGVTVVTAGPGSINAITGVVGGWTDSAPMMVISGQSPLPFIEYLEESGIRMYGIQGINIKPFVEKTTKYFVTVDDPSKIKYYMEKAYYLATTGRPGPVWIDVPLDIQRMQVPESMQISYTPEEDHSILNSKRISNIKQVCDLLNSAVRPLIIAGQGVRSSGAQQSLMKLIEKLQIPVITSRLGIDLIESSHDLYVGRPGNYGERSANFAVQNADIILSIGSRLATALIGHDAKQFGKHAKIIVVDIDPKELEKPGINAFLKIQDDARTFIAALESKMNVHEMKNHDEWNAQCLAWKNKYPVVLPEYALETPINSYHFMDELCRLSDKDDVVLVDTGSCFHVACQSWKIKKGQRYLTSGGLSSMGYWAAGIGACAANQYGNTIVITGDGSLQMNIQEFATIKHNNLPIKVFILNNNGYLLIRQTQNNFMSGRLFGESPESGVWCPDSLKIAEAYGIKGVRIDSLDDMDKKIEEVLAFDGPVICDVMTPQWQPIIPRVSSDKMPDGRLISRKYEDMYPFLNEAEFKSNMISEKE